MHDCKNTLYKPYSPLLSNILTILLIHCFSRILPLHDSHQILAIRLARWQREVGEVREWYRKEHRNWVSIDGQRSKWWVWHEALNEASKGVRQIQTYLQRLSEGNWFIQFRFFYVNSIHIFCLF